MSLFSPAKKFKEPLNTIVYTTIHVMKNGSAIKLISHELDGDWQFMEGEPLEDYSQVAMIVSLEQIIKLDKSVLKIVDLPMGYQATRDKKSDKWSIAKILYSEEEIKQFGYYCSKCGMYHKDIPMAYGSDAPYQYSLISNEEQKQRSTLTNDQCIIDNKNYFIRAQIKLSVDDNPDSFCWNVWVLINKEDFDRMNELCNDENRILEKSVDGKLATQLEVYSQTLNLPVKVITQKVGFVPRVELTESNHPLFLEQENGIDMNRVIFFAKEILYNH